MALSMTVSKFGQSFPSAYVRVHRVFGSKQEGLTYTVRTYLNRAAYESGVENHIDEKQFNMPFPPASSSAKYPDDCYSHLIAQPDYASAAPVLESGQVAAPANATI